MKKLFPVVAVALIATMFTSCKKEYTCTCTVTVGGMSTSSSASLGKLTKKDAEAACTARSTSVSGVTATCSL